MGEPFTTTIMGNQWSGLYLGFGVRTVLASSYRG